MTPVSMRWRKSSRSAEETNCVELAHVHTGVGAVRDSKSPAGALLVFDVKALLSAIKAGTLGR